MSMDISETIQPRSDQQNYDDYLAGPKTVTVSEVRKGTPDQPVEIHLAEFPGRPFKPSKTVRRVLVSAWGPDAGAYVGRRMTLFGDPTVTWAGTAVGGIRVSHLSHIEKPLTLNLTATRGKRSKTTIQPLVETAPEPQPDWDDLIKQADGEVHTLRAIWTDANQRGADKATLDRIANAAKQAQEATP